jgi:glycosyltransferase involved in cell wall biosynthesis
MSKPSVKKKPTLCLTMIVKNEYKTIKRCIDSVRDYIDYWVICDTGSTDGTQELIKDIMDEYNIPGELHERPWVDFGYNRTESLEYSKGKADYRLVIDADDYLIVDEGVNPFEKLTLDSYKVKIHLGAITYYRTQIIRGEQDWKYIGVLHEYLAGPEGMELKDDFLPHVMMEASISGHNREVKGKNKYHNDALIFEKALITTPKEKLSIDLQRRYVFYMGQSYRDAGMYDRAIESYNKRIELGGWEEEIFISKYWVAKMMTTQSEKYDESEIINSYLKAWEYRPTRLEPMYNLIKYLGSKKRYGLALVFASTSLRTPPCNDVLFVEEEIWRWRMSDEYAVLCYYNGNSIEAHRTTKMLMESDVYSNIPEKDQERIEKNMEFYSKSIENNKTKDAKEVKDTVKKGEKVES